MSTGYFKKAENFVVAIQTLSPENLLLVVAGVLVGLVFGAIPGLSTTKAQPFIIGILVGFMAEQNSRRAIMYSEGSFLYYKSDFRSIFDCGFWQHWIYDMAGLAKPVGAMEED